MSWFLTILALYLGLCLLLVLATDCARLVAIGKPVRFRREAVSRLFREWMAIAMVPLMYLSGLGQAGLKATWHPDGGPERTPVLLVPGYGLNRGCWRFFAFFLRQHGWTWVHPITNAPLSAPIPSYAEALSRNVDMLCLASGAERVDIVGHSMGGLVAAWYVNHLGGDAKVRRLVTLGTPWQGSRVIVFGKRKQAQDLLPGSEFLNQLGPPKVATTSIWSQGDELIIPSESPRIAGLHAMEIDECGHVEMLQSARVFRLVAAELDSPDGVHADHSDHGDNEEE